MPHSPVGMPSELLNVDTQGAIDALIARASTRGEVAVSIARALFCAAVLIRDGLLVMEGVDVSGAALAISGTAAILAIAASQVTIRRARDALLSARWLTASIVFDGLTCTAALLPSVLWPWQGYEGFVRNPDAAVPLVVIFAIALRIPTPRAALSGGLHVVLSLGLVLLDWLLRPDLSPRLWVDVTLYAVLLTSSFALTVVIAARTRRLVRKTARESVRLSRARAEFDTLLRAHHDVRTLLSSASINTDLVVRELSKGPRQEQVEASSSAIRLAEIAEDLQADLRDASRMIHSVKERAFHELSLLGRVERVRLDLALMQVVDASRRRAAELEISVSCEEGIEVAIAGGLTALERMIANLVVNACEGDGRRSAKRIAISVLRREDDVTIDVCDDGPGFPGGLLGVGHGNAVTTKPGGSGLGLLLVEGLVRASGGCFRKDNLPEGGGRVSVTLPLWS